MVVSYTAQGDSFEPGKPRRSGKGLAEAGSIADLDISPDGKRFVALPSAETVGEPRSNRQVTFLENFFDEVRRRASMSK